MSVSIENTSEYNVTVIGVGGSFHKVETDALIKNVSGILITRQSNLTTHLPLCRRLV